MHHVLNSLFDLGKGSRLATVVQHGYHRVHAPEHLSQYLVLVRKGEARGSHLSKGVVPLVRWQLRTKGQDGNKNTMTSDLDNTNQVENIVSSDTHLSWV